MRRFATSVLPLLMAAFMFTSGALAQNVHFKGGRNAGPQFRDLGTQLQTCVSLAGLGNEDVTIVVQAQGEATAICVNPGGNVAPGQNKVPIEVTVADTISADEIKNGNLRTCLTTPVPDELDPVEAGCPNANWSAPVSGVDFTSATITVIQGGQIVLQQTFTP